MPALVLAGMTLWTLIGERWQLLKRGFKGDLVVKAQEMFIDPVQVSRTRGYVDGFLGRGIQQLRSLGRESGKELDFLVIASENEITRYKGIIRSLCGIAPLLGLLGTVSGMIETFYSLTAMELFTQSGGVAGGIAEALISTQMGLIVAIPGVIVGRLLDRKEEILKMEIHRARDYLMRTADQNIENVTEEP
ncbi:MAG: MotA/TolQ/ExbB proton channel family protein [Deltaproteobacteria bacterium]|nr:MotA/TolQ/ExbB proton channel family protein [Deltaproteobacteria bacterium]